MSNVGRHKEPVSESHASRRCTEVVKASGSVLSASAEPQSRAIHALRSRQDQSAFAAVATVIGSSSRRATHGFRNHRGEAFRAQLVPALARRRRQMLVSQWALPLRRCRSALPGTEPRGSGAGGSQAVTRLPTAVTPNLSIEGTASGLRPPAAPHVKRWASQGTSL